ncbi:MAG: aminopeptidase [Dysgonamonadaceae bacterium]|jgi:aminopeptidase C|nr:aminopeptidase [Dysgonamonadaceae bacterium]
MKRFILPAMLVFCLSVFAQEKAKVDTFEFTTVKALPITPVKNQSSSGTCWSFSGIGFIESELLRMGKGEYDLSEMYVVYQNYVDKLVKYVRMHGETTLAGGGSFADVLDCIRDYGIVPNDVQTGLNYGDTIHRHGELDALVKAYGGVIIKNPNKKLSSAWLNGYKGILDAYLGKAPESFQYKGKTYTPKSFASELGINTDNYVSITSFTHHPFYTSFAVEIPDNWRWAESYNLPLEEMMQVLDNALDKGYTVAWASDVSEKGFNRKGIAIVPDADAVETAGSDQERWVGVSKEELQNRIANLSGPVPERKIDQQMRQEGFDNYETTDDHGMLIYGTAKDQNGSKYYLVKNSWGPAGTYKGTWYASVPFVEYKTISIVVHKDAIPKDLQKKLGLK